MLPTKVNRKLYEKKRKKEDRSDFLVGRAHVM